MGSYGGCVMCYGYSQHLFLRVRTNSTGQQRGGSWRAFKVYDLSGPPPIRRRNPRPSFGAWWAFVTALMSRMQQKWCCARSKAAFGKSLQCLQASLRTVPRGGSEEKCPRSPSCLNLPSSSTRPISEENFETTHI